MLMRERFILLLMALPRCEAIWKYATKGVPPRCLRRRGPPCTRWESRHCHADPDPDCRAHSLFRRAALDRRAACSPRRTDLAATSEGNRAQARPASPETDRVQPDIGGERLRSATGPSPPPWRDGWRVPAR